MGETPAPTPPSPPPSVGKFDRICDRSASQKPLIDLKPPSPLYPPILPTSPSLPTRPPDVGPITGVTCASRNRSSGIPSAAAAPLTPEAAAAASPRRASGGGARGGGKVGWKRKVRSKGSDHSWRGFQSEMEGSKERKSYREYA